MKIWLWVAVVGFLLLVIGFLTKEPADIYIGGVAILVGLTLAVERLLFRRRSHPTAMKENQDLDT